MKIRFFLPLLLLFSISSLTFAGGNSTRLRCKAEGVEDTSMDARYEERRNRAKFDASFEAFAEGPFSAGDVLQVSVGGIEVGSMTLAADPANGDIIGDLEFDTQADENNPFPESFPDVNEGTSVTVGSLGCALE